MKIDEALMILKNEQPHCGERLHYPEEKKYEAYDLAIRSLEAWDRMRSEFCKYIETTRDKMQYDSNSYYSAWHDGVKDCYSRIKGELDMLEEQK